MTTRGNLVLKHTGQPPTDAEVLALSNRIMLARAALRLCDAEVIDTGARDRAAIDAKVRASDALVEAEGDLLDRLRGFVWVEQSPTDAAPTKDTDGR